MSVGGGSDGLGVTRVVTCHWRKVMLAKELRIEGTCVIRAAWVKNGSHTRRAFRICDRIQPSALANSVLIEGGGCILRSSPAGRRLDLGELTGRSPSRVRGIRV